MTPSIIFNVCLPYTIKARKKWDVASCRILDVHSQGETKDKAVEKLKEAVSMFLVSCYKRGTLDAVLKECGFLLVQTPKVASIKHTVKGKKIIDVPVMQFLNTRSHKQNAQCLA